MNESLADTVVSSWMNRQQLMTRSLSYIRQLGFRDFFQLRCFRKNCIHFLSHSASGREQDERDEVFTQFTRFPWSSWCLVLLLESESWCYLIVLLFKLLTRFPQSESWPSYCRRPAVRCASEE